MEARVDRNNNNNNNNNNRNNNRLIGTKNLDINL